MGESLSKVKFDKIRYANCWEDADLLLNALKPRAGSRILSICSAGDNSLSLLCSDPEEVVASDLSAPQLYLTELKIAAFRQLEYEELLMFLGVRHSQDRSMVFQKLRSELSSGCIDFFGKNSRPVERGLIHAGKFENYFRLFRQYIMPLIHSRKVIRELMVPRTAAEQKEFYFKTWNNFRWRLLFRIFFSRTVMGRLGRDPRFLKEVDIPVGPFLFNRAEQYVGSADMQANPYLHYIFIGNYGRYLPHYLREENFLPIKRNLRRLTLKQGYIQDIKDQNFTHFNLSNIFEYMDGNSFCDAAKQLANIGEKDARYFYWNLMVPRQMSQTLPEYFMRDSSWEREKAEDKCFFYRDALSDIRI